MNRDNGYMNLLQVVCTACGQVCELMVVRPRVSDLTACFSYMECIYQSPQAIADEPRICGNVSHSG